MKTNSNHKNNSKYYKLFAIGMLVSTCIGLPGLSWSTPKSTNAVHVDKKKMPSVQQKTLSPELVKLRKDASKLLADVNIANIALLHNMHGEAVSHVKSAVELAKNLERQVKKYNSSDPIKFGKIRYKKNQAEYNYWLPLVDETFVSRTLSDLKLSQKAPDVQLIDSHAISEFVAIDTKLLREKVQAAQQSIRENDLDRAALLLDEATESVYRETESDPLPLDSVRDNLILTKELLHDKNYKSARISLDYADQILKSVQNGEVKNEEEDQKTLASLRSDMNELKTKLAKSDPSTFQWLEQHVKASLEKVEKLL